MFSVIFPIDGNHMGILLHVSLIHREHVNFDEQWSRKRWLQKVLVTNW